MQWRREVRWNIGDLGWRVGALFVIGSFCFALGSFPPYAHWIDPRAVAVTFAVGSVFFTSAGYSQFLQALNEDATTFRYLGFRNTLFWWATAVQLAGTIFFNISTFGALVEGLDTQQENRLVWAPDIFGSIAFLVASHLAWMQLSGRFWYRNTDDPDWWSSMLNYLGSVFFRKRAMTFPPV